MLISKMTVAEMSAKYEKANQITRDEVVHCGASCPTCMYCRYAADGDDLDCFCTQSKKGEGK